MLTFYFKVREEVPSGTQWVDKDIDWKVGDVPPSEYMDDADIQIVFVMADGDELSHIMHHFHHFPCVKRSGRSCVWRGEFAQFLFDNL